MQPSVLALEAGQNQIQYSVSFYESELQRSILNFSNMENKKWTEDMIDCSVLSIFIALKHLGFLNVDEELHILHQLHSSTAAPFHSFGRPELRHLASWKQQPMKPLAWVFYPSPGGFSYFSRRPLLRYMPQQGPFSERTVVQSKEPTHWRWNHQGCPSGQPHSRLSLLPPFLQCWASDAPSIEWELEHL